MITAAQHEHIERHAYLPEHVPEYVAAISRTETFLFGDFLAYANQEDVILIGYPLTETFAEKRMEEALEAAVTLLNPKRISLMAPSLPPSLARRAPSPPDHYYRLDLATLRISQKVRNMLKRAGRELDLGMHTCFDEEHRATVAAFLETHAVDEATRFIFQGIDRYVASSKTAAIFDARNAKGELVAFDIADFKPWDYGLYMFNFRSEARSVPGASDLLLARMIEQARTMGKRYLNLGLGISPGVTFFKEKWGGTAFLPHTFCLYHPGKRGLLEMLLRWV